jgi:hypothetical protein
VALGPAAARKARALREAIDAVNREALAEFNATDREALLAMLRKVIATLEPSARERSQDGAPSLRDAYAAR